MSVEQQLDIETHETKICKAQSTKRILHKTDTKQMRNTTQSLAILQNYELLKSLIQVTETSDEQFY